MNAFLNIQVRVAANQANAQLKAMQGSLNAMQRQLNGGAAAATSFNSAFRMSNLEKFGKNLQWTGRQLEFNFTLPLVLAGAAATKWSLDIQAAMTRVRKVYGDGTLAAEDLEAELLSLEKSFRLLSDRFGVHQAEVIEIASGWAQAGAAGVGLARATRLTLETMILGEMDATKAMEGLLAVQSAYRLNTIELRQELGKLNMIENETGISLQGLIDVITRAGGTARTAGIDVRYLGAMAATLVPATGSASQAGNALRTVISRIMSPTGDAAEVMATFGINVQDASWQAMNGVQRIEAMSTAFDGLTQSQKAVASSYIASRWQINRFDIMMEDVSKSLDPATRAQSVYARALDGTADAAGVAAAEQEYMKRMATELSIALSSTPRAFSILTTTIQNTMAEAIMPLLPSLVAILREVAKMTQWFARLDEDTRKMALAFLFFLAVIGPVTRYIGSFTLLFTTLWHAIQFVGVHAALATGRMAVFTGSLFGLLRFPFRGITAMFDLMWFGFSSGIKLAMSSLGFLMVSMFDVVAYLSGPLRRAVAIAAIAVGPQLQAAVMAGVAGMQAFGRFLAYGLPLMLDVARVGVQRLAIFMSTLLPRASIMAQAAMAGFGRLVATLPLFLTTAMTGLTRLVIWFTTGLPVAISAAGTALTRFFIWISTGIPAVMGAVNTALIRGFILMQAAMTRALAAMSTAMTAFMGLMGRLPALMAVVWSGVHRAAVMGLTAVTKALVAFAHGLPAISRFMVMALTNPWTYVVIAIATIIWSLRDEINQALSNIVGDFNSFPEAIAQSLIVLVNFVKKVALAVYDWLSYINPFARHSPSLVDNVTAGVSTILDQYGRLSGVGDIIRNASKAFRDFQVSTSGAKGQIRLGDFAEQREDIVAVSPQSAGAVDALIDNIFALEEALDSVNFEIADQARLVSDMRNAYETALRPINDAIWENEMAQKRLRLEILKAEESGQAIDDLRDRYSKLAGEIEMLRGEREDLRAAGAGADILGPLDQQIAALEQQRSAMEGMKSPIQEMENELDKLRRAGEIMELERDLEFDPQLKALQEEEAKLRDLESAARDIEGAIRDMEAAMRGFSQEAEKARAAGADSNALSMMDAAAAGDFEVPGGTAPPGLGREGGLADIDKFNEDLQRELDDALKGMGDFNIFDPFIDMFKSAWGWLKENVGPYAQPVIDGIRGFFDDHPISFSGIGDGIGNAFSSVREFLEPFLEVWEKVWDQIDDTFGPVVEFVLEMLAKLGKTLAKELKKWAPLFDPFMKALRNVGIFVGVVVWGIMEVWQRVWPLLRTIVEPVFNAIIGVIRGAFEIIRGIFTFFIGILSGDWRLAWEGILTFVDGIWDAIYAVIRAPIDLIVGLVQWLVDRVVGFFQWLYDVLVGNSIIPDLVNGILFWFDFLVAGARLAWEAIGAVIDWVWKNVMLPVWEAIKWTAENVLVPLFNTAKDAIERIWNAVGAAIRWTWENVIKPAWDAIIWTWDNVLHPGLQRLKTGFENIWNAVGASLQWVWDNVISPILGFFGSMWENVKTGVEAFGNGIKGVFEDIRDTVKSAINIAIEAINKITGGINSVSGTIGLDFNIPRIDKLEMGGLVAAAPYAYAAGGRVFGSATPVGAGFRTNRARAIVGEGNPLYPEYVIPTDPTYRNRAIGLATQLISDLGLQAGGIPQYAFGIGAIGDAIGGAWDAGTSLAGALAGEAREKAVQATFAPILAAVDQLLKLIPIRFVREIVNSFKNDVYNWAKGSGGFASGGILSSAHAINLQRGGLIRRAPGGTLLRIGEGHEDEAVQVLPLSQMRNGGGETHLYFYGDLVFPNITDGNDAEDLIRNLEAMAAD